MFPVWWRGDNDLKRSAPTPGLPRTVRPLTMPVLGGCETGRRRLPSPVIIPGRVRLLTPRVVPPAIVRRRASGGSALLRQRTGGAVLGEHASVSEIKRYPLRPEGFEEPLFHGRGSRAAVMEHLLEASWLHRGSELPGRGGTGMAARRTEEPVEVRRVSPRRSGGGTDVVVSGVPCSACARRRGVGRVRRVLDRWREVGGWWEAPSERVDRLVFRLELAGEGAVVDVALDRTSGRWLLVGVVD